jgi:hypothetical protein
VVLPQRVPVLAGAAADLLQRRLRLRADILAAVSALPAGEPILAHVFSNGGGHQLRQLSVLHRVPLAIRALVLDSCPGSSRLLTAARGLAATVCDLPWHARIPALASIYFLSVLVAGVAQYILRACGIRSSC